MPAPEGAAGLRRKLRGFARRANVPASAESPGAGRLHGSFEGEGNSSPRRGRPHPERPVDGHEGITVRERGPAAARRPRDSPPLASLPAPPDRRHAGEAGEEASGIAQREGREPQPIPVPSGHVGPTAHRPDGRGARRGNRRCRRFAGAGPAVAPKGDTLNAYARGSEGRSLRKRTNGAAGSNANAAPCAARALPGRRREALLRLCPPACHEAR